jgi:transposase
MSPHRDKPFWIGIDLSRRTLWAAIAPEGTPVDRWRDLPSREFENSARGLDALSAWARRRGGRCAGLVVESSGALTRPFVEAIGGRALPAASVVNPARPLALARSLGVRDKTDRVDAAILAVFGAVHHPPAHPPRSGASQRLRDLDRLRETLVTERVAWRNRLGAAHDAQVRRVVGQTLAHLSGQVARVERQMDQVIAGDAAVARRVGLLRSVAGIGPVTARTLEAQLGDLCPWRRNALVSFAGLFPKRFESGTSVRRRPRLARGGGGRLRRVLFMAAMSAVSHPGPLREWSHHLQSRAKSPKCALGAVMRKLLLVARAVEISGRPFDASLLGPPRPAEKNPCSAA